MGAEEVLLADPFMRDWHLHSIISGLKTHRDYCNSQLVIPPNPRECKTLQKKLTKQLEALLLKNQLSYLKGVSSGLVFTLS
jgi:hypothetical protein